jgi:hypothetical protein
VRRRFGSRQQWAALVLAAVLVAYLGSLVWSGLTALPRSQAIARQAIAAEQATTARDLQEIAKLQGQISALQGNSQGNTGRIDQLIGEVAVLEAQVRSLGATPVVSEPAPAGAPPATSPGSTTSTTGAPPHRPPSTTTTTTRPCPRVPVIGVCI